MAVKDILNEIDREIARLEQAKNLLGGVVTASPKTPRVAKTVKVDGKKKKRNISPEGRKRIADAVKRRWAAQRKSAASDK